MQNQQPRERHSGRYTHEWGVIGHNPETNREFAQCQLCGKVWAYGGGQPDRTFKDADDAARKERVEWDY